MDYKNPVVVDFETYYDDEYSLRKMTTEEYLRDERFECIGLSIKNGDNPTEFYRGEDWIDVVTDIINNEPDRPFVAHNAVFDGGILGLCYDLHPKHWLDTVSMARVTYLDQKARSGSLDNLSKALIGMGYIMPNKGSYVADMNGVHRDDMTEEQWQAYADYCKTDSDICRNIYDVLYPILPESELKMMDITTRMYTNPKFEFDQQELEDYKKRLEDAREDNLKFFMEHFGFESLDATEKAIRSRTKFPELLEQLGVSCPMKWSEKQEKMVPALAKTDEGLTDLLNHPNHLVSELVETKLNANKSLAMSRTQAFLELGRRGPVPVPLKYYAAHTGRYGGCFVGETKVLCRTEDGEIVEKVIVDVLTSDLVWDGKQWCEHSGVEFNGYQDVITHEGLTGTKNHRVFVDETHTITLEQAKKNDISVFTCKVPDGVDARTITHTRTKYGFGVSGIRPVYDITNCGPNNRYMANGKLVHNSDKLNFQNLPKRSGDTTLRRSMIAPHDHVVIGTDSSQIEARLLAYVAGEVDLIDIFITGKCPYSDMAADIYGETYDKIYHNAKVEPTKEGVTKRNVGKTTVLGCIAEGTEVLTHRGWVPIEHVTDSDLLWDGHGYVPHEGLVDKGYKECLEFNGAYMTPDHKVFDGNRWMRSDEAHSLLVQAWALQNTPPKYWSDNNSKGAQVSLDLEHRKTYDILNVGRNNRFFIRGKDSQITCVHNCGYQMGSDAFSEQLRQAGLEEVIDMAPLIVKTYRAKNAYIKRFWNTCQNVLDVLIAGQSISFGGPKDDLFYADGSTEFWGEKVPSIRLPNGTYLVYRNLRVEEDPESFMGYSYKYDQYKHGKFIPNYIYGGKLTENLIQALAFAVLKHQAILIDSTGVPVNLNVHDEWVSVVPKSVAKEAISVHAVAMRSVPEYIPQGLLDCEVDIGKNYMDTQTLSGV